MVPLIPRNEKFLAPFTDMAALSCEAAAALKDLLRKFDRLPERVRAIKDLEHRGDKITHGVLEALAKTFLTPLDREDIHSLATDLDDVLDMIDNAAHHVMDYGVGEGLWGAVELAEILEKQTAEIAKAMPHLGGNKEVLPHCVEIKRLETAGDAVAREAMLRLFRDQKDPILVIKWKEILENLERATDECEDVANDLEGIFVKYG
ncbi:MAG TPA: DUF47 family protein [Planctomycetota bacterium]|nr:DUF47 family protein [Planctomycetota bacterium]